MGAAVELSRDRVARAAEPVRGPVHGLAVRIASLDDLETGRIDPVERRAIIKPDRRQLEEVLAMARRHVEVALQLDLPVLGGNDGTRIFLRHAHGNPTRALMPRGGVARGGDTLVRREPVRPVVLRLEDTPLVPAYTVPPLPTAKDWIARSVKPLLILIQVLPLSLLRYMPTAVPT